jgi:hypothetical protein
MKNLSLFCIFSSLVFFAACADSSSSSVSTDVNAGNTPASSETALSSDAVSSAGTVDPSSADPESSAVLESSSSTTAAAPADTVWNKAYLTWYISWPDPGSEECVKYNGCQWAGYFAGIEGQQTEQWVSEHNIISIHEKDWDKYNGKTFKLRQNGRTIEAVVYDKCADSDCDGCCTQNAGQLDFLIDIESYTCEKFSGSKEGCDGIVEWTCLDCE